MCYAIFFLFNNVKFIHQKNLQKLCVFFEGREGNTNRTDGCKAESGWASPALRENESLLCTFWNSFSLEIFLVWVLFTCLTAYSCIYIYSVVQLLSCVWLFVTPWTAVYQASLSSPTLGVCSDSCPLTWWCYLTISSSATFFCFCLQSFPASGSFPMSWVFTSGGQIFGALA